MRKTIYTLNIPPDGKGSYEPEITELTYPLLQHFANKIGAEFHVITERKFPDWPRVYEKLQVGELARQRDDDWSYFIDSDVLVHPETIDFTEFLPHDTVAHNGADMAAIRWSYDDYFRRDGRNIGSCTWLVISHRWCTADLWRPLDDLTLEEAVANIHPTVNELTTTKTPESLIDDYTLSRNIARFGLKHAPLIDWLPTIGLPNTGFFYHQYCIPKGQKLKEMRETLEQWNIARWRARHG